MPARLRQRQSTRGFVLVALMALVTAGLLAVLVTSLSPDALDAYRERKTREALIQAREALLGYALKYRDDEAAQGRPDRMYGYLPLPDLGTSRNNNIGCAEEGCDAGNFAGNSPGITVIGRFPWRTLGVSPLRDGQGECLWLAVSGSHQRVQQSSPMNWDTLGQLDVVVANGSGSLASALASPHDRPVAVIFSAGHPLPGQNRAISTTDDVRQCGGNYDAAQYLDPGTAGALAGATNFFAGSANSAFGNTVMTAKTLTFGGNIQRQGNGTLWSQRCPAGVSCDLVANDTGLSIGVDHWFGLLRKSSGFRTDISSMLDRMTSCLRDAAVAGTALVPVPVPGTAADKTAGRIPADACYADTRVPLGYFSNWREMVFVAKPMAGGNFNNVTVDNLTQSCAAVLILAGQRANQVRASAADKNVLGNYLEGANLTSFSSIGIDSFVGARELGDARANRSNPDDIARCAPGGNWAIAPQCQTLEQDIVRCIPPSASFTTVASPALAALGLGQLAAYDPATRTLTLGQANVTTGAGAPAGALFGCAWQPEAHALGKGLRAYFQFRFRQVGTSVGSTGYVFAIADAESSGPGACGADASHLGYSGNNGVTPPLTFPKVGIEFDQSREANFSEGVGNPGRKDPCGTSGCGGSVGYNSHAAIVYWGHQAADAVDQVTIQADDDNVHGFPSSGSQVGNPRPAPRNPDASPGIEFVNLRGQASEGGNSYLYHVRVEITPERNVSGIPAQQRKTALRTEVWIERDSVTSAQLIAAMADTTRPMAQGYPGYAARLSDAAQVYDVAGAACAPACPTGQSCGSDNVCYRPAMNSVRLGFTNSQRTQDQQVDITNFFASWPQ